VDAGVGRVVGVGRRIVTTIVVVIGCVRTAIRGGGALGLGTTVAASVVIGRSHAVAGSVEGSR
jgi:hypothetical protein